MSSALITDRALDLIAQALKSTDPDTKELAQLHLAALHTIDPKGLRTAQMAREFWELRQDNPTKPVGVIADTLGHKYETHPRTVTRAAYKGTKPA